MLLIRCPYCEEERPELEFRAAGEAHIARSHDIVGETDAEFEKYFFIRSNPKGLIYERWRHIHGCGRFFNAARDTVTDKFLMTYKAGQPKPDLPAAANQNREVAAYANQEPAKLMAKKPSKTAKPKGKA